MSDKDDSSVDPEFTPTLAQVITDAMEQRLTEVHTAMPGSIVSYDSAKQLAVVQPSIMRKYKTGEIISFPVIYNVPVAFPRSGKAFLSLPLKAGDSVLLIFSERSLDIWLSGGGTVDPQDVRKHHISDAIAYPGIYPANNPFVGHATNLLLGNDKAVISLDPSGKFQLKNTAGDELFDLIDKLFLLFDQTMVFTMLGPQGFINIADYDQLRAKFAALKGSG